MKPRTFHLLEKLAHQRMAMLQQELVQLQNERDHWHQRVHELSKQVLQERGCDGVLSEGFFHKMDTEKKQCLLEIERLDQEIDILKKQTIEAWQKEEILKTLKPGSKP